MGVSVVTISSYHFVSFVFRDTFRGESRIGTPTEAFSRRLRVDPEVELGVGSDVPPSVFERRHRATHDDELFDPGGEPGLFAEGDGDVGERPDGDDGDVAGIGRDRAHDEVVSGLALGHLLRVTARWRRRGFVRPPLP
jgi:hypothetical protein